MSVMTFPKVKAEPPTLPICCPSAVDVTSLWALSIRSKSGRDCPLRHDHALGSAVKLIDTGREWLLRHQR